MTFYGTRKRNKRSACMQRWDEHELECAVLNKSDDLMDTSDGMPFQSQCIGCWKLYG